MTEIQELFTEPSLDKTIAGLSELVERTGSRSERLGRPELAAGLRTLRRAAGTESEKKRLLRIARSHFYEASRNERRPWRIVAYLAVALIHRHLQDETSAATTLRNLLRVCPLSWLDWWRVAYVSWPRHNPSESWLWISLYTIFARALIAPAIFAIRSPLFNVRHVRSELTGSLDVIAHEDEVLGMSLRVQRQVADHLGRPIDWFEEMVTEREPGRSQRS